MVSYIQYVSKLFLASVNRIPPVRKPLWRWLFNMLALKSNEYHHWRFMNYGYYDDGLCLNFDKYNLRHIAHERYSAQLYYFAGSQVPVAGRDILEIGCGRGGGTLVWLDVFGARSLVGIDISEKSVKFCRSTITDKRVEFYAMSAENISHFGRNFDTVFLVECSFAFSDLARVLKLIYYILNPGGWCVLVDLRLNRETAQFMKVFERSAFRVMRCDNISENVLASLMLDSARRKSVIDKQFSGIWRDVMYIFAGIEGTRIPLLLKRGDLRYWSVALQKPWRSDDTRRAR